MEESNPRKSQSYDYMVLDKIDSNHRDIKRHLHYLQDKIDQLTRDINNHQLTTERKISRIRLEVACFCAAAGGMLAALKFLFKVI